MGDPSDTAARVLVVDDEASLLRLVVRVLQRAGHGVVSARDGEEAIRHFEAHRRTIDVVVLDAGIPPDGASALLDTMLVGPHAPGVVVMSGDWLAPDLQDRLEACPGRFLRKPFRPQELLGAVEAVERSSGA